MGEKITYVAPDAPSFKMRITVNGVDRQLRFKNKQLILDTDDPDTAYIEDILDTLIANKPHISQIVKKVDVAAAEQLAREHHTLVMQQNSAQKGGATTANNPMLHAKLAHQAEQLKHQGVSEEDASKLLHDVTQGEAAILEKPETGDSTPDEGFIPDTKPESEAVVEPASENKTFEQLLKK